MRPTTSNHRPSTSTHRPSTPDLDLPPKPRTLRLTSYGYKNGPLIPRPHLSFDVRNLPNPPKHVRGSQSGMHKPLQDWLVGIGEVRTRLESIIEAIQARIGEVEEGDAVRGVGSDGRSVKEREREERERELRERYAREEEERRGKEKPESRMEVDSEAPEEEAEEPSDTDADSPDEDDDPTDELSIAIFCHLGKHRSVALTEILSKHRWNTRGEWDVVVGHRDLVVERTQAFKDRSRKRERDRKNSVRGGGYEEE